MDNTRQTTVLFADVSGSTKLYEAAGDAKAMEAIQSCLERLRRSSEAFGGRVVKTIGDEIMVLFPSPDAAAGASADMQHAIDAMESSGFSTDIVVLLQPTSPLRRGEHIDAAIDWLLRVRGDSVVSVVEVPHQFNPASVMKLDDGLLRPFLDGPTVTRRQDKPRLFARNGPAVLAVHARVIRQGSLYGNESWPLLMSPEDSLDIDTPWDLRLVESALSARGARLQPDQQ